MQTTFLVKVYNNSGATLKKTLKNNELLSDPTFKSIINGGLGQLELNVNIAFEEADTIGWIDLMNIVKVYAITDKYPKGTLIYTGFISKSTPYLTGSANGIKLNILGMVSLLSFAYYKDGTSFTVNDSDDPADIFSNILTHFQSVYGSIITAGTLTTIGVTSDIEFEKQTWSNAIKKTFDTVGSGYYWTIDNEAQLNLLPQPTSATHTFTIGFDVQELKLEKDVERVYNSVTVEYAGGLTTTYSDATSISEYGKRERYISDSSLQDYDTARNYAIQTVEENKDPKIKASVIINNRYDIEDIKAGHTCKVQNIKKGTTIVGDNMLISAVEYSPNIAKLTLESYDNIGNEILKLVNND